MTSAGRAASHFPMVVSETPPAYTSAVSTRVPPTSVNASSWANATSSAVDSPKVILPSANADTEQPLPPRFRYSTMDSICVVIGVRAPM